MDPRFDNAEVADFRSMVGRGQASKGLKLFMAGAVRELHVDPKTSWSFNATVDEAGNSFAVTLAYDLATGWSGECDCDAEFNCRHSLAVLQAARLLPLHVVANAQGRPVRRVPSAPPPPASKPALAPSPLSMELQKALGRPLKPAEIAYVVKIRQLLAAAGQGRITNWQLSGLLTVPGPSWDPVDLFPRRPANDLECWQYVARLHMKHHQPIPEFMQAVTDTRRAEAAIRAWEREAEITRWRTLVGSAGTVRSEARTPPVKADLRLHFGAELVHVEWRSAGRDPFRKCREKDLTAIREAYHAQVLETTPETERLLLLTMPALPGYVLHYDADALLLSRILDTPDLAALTVGESGKPLARPGERLRLECVQPDSAEGDYIIRLVLPDGNTPARFMAIVKGPRDCHYLTGDALYKGPPHHDLGDETEVRIPAAAIETAEGYRFFQATEIPLPPRVGERVRVVRPLPKLALSIVDREGYHPRRELHLKVTAAAQEGPKLSFTNGHWLELNSAGRRPAPDGKIEVLDKALLNLVGAALQRLDLKWDPQLRRLYRRWPKSYPEWLVNWLRELPDDVTVELDAEIRSLLDDPVTARLRIDMQEADIDWFDVKVVMDVSDTTLTQDELALLLKAAGTPVFLPRLGAWKRMQAAWTDEDGACLAKIGLSPADLSGDPHRVHVLQLADESAAKLLPADHVEKIRRRLDELRTRVTPPLPPLVRAELRPYQIAGFHFLAYLAENRFGGVLADDMGLGKTLQALCWLAWLRSEKAPAGDALPSVVVCPKSVMENWRSEAERFYPSLRVALWSPSAGGDFATVRREADLVVLNYAQLRLLEPAALSSPWFVAILDEAQTIKNPNAQTAQAARALAATYRLALTGTPIENRLMDLWSIMAFAMPGALGNRTLFAKRFAGREDPLARGRLAARVRPFLIRRTKEEVAPDLPERIEEDLVCEMEGEQRTLYQAELKCARQLLLGVQSPAEFNRERFNFLTALLRLRQICCHAELLGGHAGVESAKLGALLELLEPLMEEGHKVLVFSQFVQMLAIIERHVAAREWPRFVLTGATEDRGALVRAFQDHAGSAVFLLSLKAGGFGLNLTAANYVVLYDPWWNPAVERQAIDRTHRIGQVNPVNAYRLLAKSSIEQKIRLLQQQKSALAEAVLGDERFGEALTLDDLKFILQD